MPKRGQRQPWRVSYRWDSGIKGSKTFGSLGDAELFEAQLRRTSENSGHDITITVENRDATA